MCLAIRVQYLRTDLVRVVKGEHEIRPTARAQGAVRTRLAFDLPPSPKQRGKNAARFGGGPLRHTAATENESDCGRVSPCSSRSAMTRRARTCAFAIASSRVAPYARTPGSCGTSASHRPSSSRSHSMLKFTVYSRDLQIVRAPRDLPPNVEGNRRADGLATEDQPCAGASG